ncbi:hypothetical protein [Micromonospora craterilacus]|uniref:hypothetical protein n=1 Tax=Micromonospora craterilacus TaxID=1655439 RepID=UPI0013140091|nr:hypothetical protein [Micromonospora craterilacus]
MDVQAFQVGVGDRWLACSAAGGGLGVGCDLVPRSLLLKLAGVLVVDFLEFAAGAADGLGGRRQGVLVGGGGVVRTPYLLDQVV